MTSNAMPSHRCRALFVSAPASHQGKTTITAGLARYHRNQGRRVRVFKTGPDFLDPMILEQASGNPVGQLDLFMGGDKHCQQQLYEAAGQSDLIIVEGVMGLFDGSPSSADLCLRFDLPILLVINASSMAQTIHAVAHGLATYRPALKFWGMVANAVASQRHADMLELPEQSSVRYLGGIRKSALMQLPERHLGLVQAAEIEDIEARLSAAAIAVAQSPLSELPDEMGFEAIEADSIAQSLDGTTIAVARDQAFSFVYNANLHTLKTLGAKLVFFSPLSGGHLPSADAVYLPGGYPELHMDKLGQDNNLRDSLRAHFHADKPIYAECGGMLYSLDSLTDRSGTTRSMLGLLPGSATMQSRLMGLGYQEIDLPGGTVRGHTFHHSISSINSHPAQYARRAHDGSDGEPVYRLKKLWASYLHLYFPSNPQAVASLFRKDTSVNPCG